MAYSSKKKLSPDDLIPGGKGYKQFLPSTMVELSLSLDGATFRYKKEEIYKECALKDNSLIWAFSLDDLNALLLAHNDCKPCDEMPMLHFLQENRAEAWVIIDECIWFLNCAVKKVLCRISFPENGENLSYNEKARLFSYTHKGGLFLLTLQGESFLVMKKAASDILVGAVPSRNEFGIEDGSFWSPNGRKLAFYIVNQTGIPSYPLVKIQEPMAEAEPIKYPMAGGKSEEVRLAIYDIDSAEVVELEPSDWSESYLTCVTWNPDETALFVVEVNRRQNHCRLQKYDATDGRRVSLLFEERDDMYLEPQHPLLFLDSERFVWQSRRDGYNHLNLYGVDGNLIRQLTRGAFEVTHLYGYCEATDELVFLSTFSSPLNRDACAVSVGEGVMRLLSIEKGSHSLALSLKTGLFIDSFSSIEVPSCIEVGSLLENEKRVLYLAANPYEGYEVPCVEVGSYMKDGDEIYYRIVRPVHLETGKRYPLAYYVYGGPHVQLIRNEWMAGTKGFEYMMALNGYVVMSIDPHGSDCRGKSFEQKIWRNIGAQQMDDYVYSVKWLLREKNYIDERRMGVYGWSFGGFMATRLMLRQPTLFAFGVAGGAVIDWAKYEVMYTERYMLTPDVNPDGYKENNLCHFIDNLQGDLLLIHCDNDPVVLWQHTLMLVRKSISAHKQIDYAIYPGHQHNVQGIDRVHLMERIKHYFDEKAEKSRVKQI